MTEIALLIDTHINSQANHPGEKFAITLAEPIVVDGKTLVPAGIKGSGDIVHAAKSRFGGKPGELIIAARFLDFNGIKIPLRTFRYGPGAGKGRGDEAAAAAIAAGAIGAVVGALITGGEVDIPAGTRATAKVSALVSLTGSPPISSPQNTTGETMP